MSEGSHIKASTTRWGLLITTIALGVVLVAMGIVSYLGARGVSRDLIWARGLDMVISVRRAVRQSDGDHQAALEDVVEEMGEQGLRFALLLRSDQGVVAQAGTPSGRLEVERWRRVRPGSGPRVSEVSGRVRVVAPYGRGVGRRPWREKLGPRAGRLEKRGGLRGQDLWTKAGQGPGKRRGGLLMSGGVLVLEFEPVVAQAITNRALTQLVISVAAATLLLIVAVIFWRLSLRAERMGEQLAMDRQLKVLGEMSAVLGHELRNPLAALKGHAQLLVELLSKDGGHPGRFGAETVVREALRMEKLTEQILEFARTGAIDLQPESPEEIARAAVEGAGFDGFELDLQEGLPEILLDRIRIERVLVNLLKNAHQASPEDGIVKLSARVESGGLLYEVRDQGEGLPAGEEEWIFEPFHTKRVRGTGLGLAVSKRIVEAHSGRISAKNHPEGGALFRVWLPLEAPRKTIIA